ncbi:MAG: hypothetical protein IPP15_20080 [Saprospiraceae bacterium]|uniref:Lipoprotein n=1 Tax=Candidatus Opimibacter skivensis TaxID=2982028 RepID=A0A9D7SYM1_9BACT|nr:hypothetical protein [Candidatus Opimibacter skivensis]
MKLLSKLASLSALILISLLSLTSCGDIISDLKINPDGSGSLETTFDVGDLMSMAKGFQGMGTDSTGSTDDTMAVTTIVEPDTAAKDPMKLLIEKVTDPAYDRDVDTLMSILSIMPDSVKSKQTNLDLANKLSLRLVSPAKSANLKIGIVANFDNSKQLKEIMEYMESLNDKPEMMASAGPMGFQTKSFLLFDADMKSGQINVSPIDYGSVSAQFGMSQDSTSSSENIGMLQMMFGNSKIKSVIQVPGEVLSCSNPDAILTKDNKVLLEYNFMDVINKGSIEGFTIHFQPRK